MHGRIDLPLVLHLIERHRRLHVSCSAHRYRVVAPRLAEAAATSFAPLLHAVATDLRNCQALFLRTVAGGLVGLCQATRQTEPLAP